MPGVTVEVTNTATGQMRNAVTGADGYYAVPLLQPGPYEVKATLAGFKPVARAKGSTSRSATRAGWTCKLAVGGLEETRDGLGRDAAGRNVARDARASRSISRRSWSCR